MEGVGARLGRSSTRYGPTTVFTGPVRKWKKKWVHVSPSSASSNHHRSQISNGTTTTTTTTASATTNGNNGSHLLLYKWTPITQSLNNNSSSNNNNGDKSSAKEEVEAIVDDASAAEEPPRRKFKYVPIAVLEEQRDEGTEKAEDEATQTETEPNAAELKNDDLDDKPDINDVTMEERQAQDDNSQPRQDLNESTLDLSLGLAHDGDNDSDSKTDRTTDVQLERLYSGGTGT